MSESALKAATPSLSSTEAQQGQGIDDLSPFSQALLSASYDNNNVKSYPPNIATYEKLVEDAVIFKQTHDLFLKMLGKYVEVPKVGEDDLDLHRLFVEVTSRGGIEKVISDRKWEDVVHAYDLPPTPTITSPSLFLRSHYISLLYHYEQVYYFQKQAPGGAPMPAITSMGIIDESTQGVVAPFADPSLAGLVGSTLSGTIEGKCGNGYFVSVDLGSHKLEGVLFPVREETTEPQVSESLVASTRQGRKRSPPDSGLPELYEDMAADELQEYSVSNAR